MIHNLAALTLVVAQATAPDPLTEAALNALRASIAEAKEAQGALPPPQTDQERLERMGAIDQAARQGLWKALANVPPPERARVRRALWPEVRAVDVENQQQLLAMVPEDGWFRKSRYGDNAAASAFHVGVCQSEVRTAFGSGGSSNLCQLHALGVALLDPTHHLVQLGASKA